MLDQLYKICSIQNLLFIFNAILRFFDKIWHYNILTADSQKITIGNIVVAVVVMTIGSNLANRLKATFKSRLLKRLNIADDSSQIFEAVFYYSMLCIVFLIALEMANIPLNTFAFAGGAIIGLGFVAKDMINDFLSGLVIIAEKPIRIGDVVQIAGFEGNVVEIGTRCIIINNFDDIEVLIPNSVVLRSNIVNWNYHNSIIRYQLFLCVPHNSDAQLVKSILVNILKEVKGVLNKPAYSVYLMSFDEIGMNFEVNYFYDHLGKKARKEIVNDINFEIARRFKMKNIEFAVHSRNIKISDQSSFSGENNV